MLHVVAEGRMMKVVELVLRSEKNVEEVAAKVWAALLAAALADREEAVRFLLGEVADGKKRHAEGDNAFHTAVWRGSLEVAKALARNGDSTDELSEVGERALQFAPFKRNEKLIRFPFDRDACPKLIEEEVKDSVLHAALQ